jgi:hypothetical protein
MFVAPPASVLACVDVLTALSDTIPLTPKRDEWSLNPAISRCFGLQGPMVCGSL